MYRFLKNIKSAWQKD